jgi:twitching motility protein PilT
MTAVDSRAIDSMLATVWDRAGTDLLLVPGAPPFVRVDGLLVPLPDQAVLTASDTERIVRSMIDHEQFDALVADRQIDFSFDWRAQTRLRANAFYQRDSIGLSLRIIPYLIPSFDELGLPPIVDHLMDQPQGLVLVTGPTGSGKSTTLAAMIDVINERHAKHIITIEEPLEYVHKHKRSAVTQREVGRDCWSFDDALHAALREDPDVILLGEMRDLESIQTALTLAETGHLIFSTLHTNDAAMAMDRIVDVFPPGQQNQIRVQLSGALSAVISQRLLRRNEGGRCAAFEVLTATYAVRALVRDGKSAQLRNAISTGTEHGMQTLESNLSELVAGGVVDHEEACRISMHPNEVKRRRA